MKSIRHRLGLLVGAVAVIAALVPVESAQADPVDAATCDIVGFVVKDPTHLVESSSGQGLFGSVEVAGTPVDSRIVCKGSLVGQATIEGDFEWCPNDHTVTPATACSSAPQTIDEALWPDDLPTSVHVIGDAATASTLTLVDGLQQNVSCSFDFNGHAFVPLPRLDVFDVVCGDHEFTGTAEAGFVPIVGNDAGDLFEADPDPESCASWASQTGGEDCFRAVVFVGEMTIHTL